MLLKTLAEIARRSMSDSESSNVCYSSGRCFNFVMVLPWFNALVIITAKTIPTIKFKSVLISVRALGRRKISISRKILAK
jgi:hypothetical protein